MKHFLVVAALAACGDNGQTLPDAALVDAAPREVIMENLPLVVGDIVEAKLIGGRGDTARLRLVSTAPIDWNIHGHANGGTQIVGEELNVTAVDYVFAPTAQADWYLLIRNIGTTDATVQITIDLYGAITWSGWI